MTKMSVLYEGQLHTQITHTATGHTIHTDAPKDNQGKGETFSPTDLLAASLASCIATVIGIYGERNGWDLRSMKVEIEKVMSSDPPRRIAKLLVSIQMPSTIAKEEKEKILKIAHTCPVHQSLHPSIEVPMEIGWQEEKD